MEDKHLSPLTSLQPFITSLGLWVFSEQHNPMSVGVVLQRLCDCVCETVWLCVSEWVSECECLRLGSAAVVSCTGLLALTAVRKCMRQSPGWFSRATDGSSRSAPPLLLLLAQRSHLHPTQHIDRGVTQPHKEITTITTQQKQQQTYSTTDCHLCLWATQRQTHLPLIKTDLGLFTSQWGEKSKHD